MPQARTVLRRHSILCCDCLTNLLDTRYSVVTKDSSLLAQTVPWRVVSRRRRVHSSDVSHSFAPVQSRVNPSPLAKTGCSESLARSTCGFSHPVPQQPFQAAHGRATPCCGCSGGRPRCVGDGRDVSKRRPPARSAGGWRCDNAVWNSDTFSITLVLPTLGYWPLGEGEWSMPEQQSHLLELPRASARAAYRNLGQNSRVAECAVRDRPAQSAYH